jgi:hypothetical protein
MRNEHNTDNKRQPGQQAQPGKQSQQQDKSDGNRQPAQQSQQDKSDHKRQAGQQSKQGKSAGSYGSQNNGGNKEQGGKGKVASSNRDGEKSDTQRL